MNLKEFYAGEAFDAHRYFGAHIEEKGVLFRTYAPGALGIEVIGEFNDWQGTRMYREGSGGIYSVWIPNAHAGQMYKYKIYKKGAVQDHCDPYGFGMEKRPGSASVIVDLSEYRFGDGEWMAARKADYNAPLSIYELHLGSFRTRQGKETAWYRYEELADVLIPYLKENYYNYVEFMPLCEHPLDASWGYQNTGFFSPTSRYGTAAGLKELVDRCHRAGIGVILDFVPVHFAVDAYGRAKYDGTALYEYPHTDVGVSEWGSHNFMHSRGEVRSFLQSSAAYWLEEYHFDGLRMDAVSRIIYWQGDPARGVNNSAVNFLKFMNRGLRQRFPGILLMAEDSTDYPGVTGPVDEGGLGFDYKWDMGWMNDTLDYFKKTPKQRTENYHKLTFSMMYFYNERYLLPLSHDEVVHGKATIVQKMYGEYEDKFPQARAFYLYMYVHPGKKLNFMGNEIAQLREWDESREQDWGLAAYPIHAAFHRFMMDLNRLYLEEDAFYAGEYEPGQFEWLDCHEEEKRIYAIRRMGSRHDLTAVFNFSDQDETEYVLPWNENSAWFPLLDSSWEIYGGGTRKSTKRICPEQGPEGGRLKLSLPAYSGALYRTEKMD